MYSIQVVQLGKFSFAVVSKREGTTNEVIMPLCNVTAKTGNNTLSVPNTVYYPKSSSDG